MFGAWDWAVWVALGVQEVSKALGVAWLCSQRSQDVSVGRWGTLSRRYQMFLVVIILQGGVHWLLEIVVCNICLRHIDFIGCCADT